MACNTLWRARMQMMMVVVHRFLFFSSHFRCYSIFFHTRCLMPCVFLPSCLDTDHIEFHAPLPASLPRRLHQPALGGCVTDGELPHVHFPRNQVHSRHGLSESPGKLMDYIISFPLFKLLEDGRVEWMNISRVSAILSLIIRLPLFYKILNIDNTVEDSKQPICKRIPWLWPRWLVSCTSRFRNVTQSDILL